MFPAESHLWSLAVAVRDTVGDYYEANGVPLPGRRYVWFGLPAFDCEQFVVSVAGTYNHQGDLAQEVLQSVGAHPGFAIGAATFDLSIIRCTPVMSDSGAPPSVDDMEAAAQLVLIDEQVMTNAIVAAVQSHTLASCNGVAFETWTAITDQGGFGGGSLRVRFSLI